MPAATTAIAPGRSAWEPAAFIPYPLRMPRSAIDDRNDGLDGVKRIIEGAGQGFGAPSWFGR
jgi:hypothetical protein